MEQAYGKTRCQYEEDIEPFVFQGHSSSSGLPTPSEGKRPKTDVSGGSGASGADAGEVPDVGPGIAPNGNKPPDLDWGC